VNKQPAGRFDRCTESAVGVFASQLTQNHCAGAPAMNRIALVMIARNEARCIARCLVSARAWVDELWVLDTGSTDATAKIAADCGARVAHFRWVDDFSAARNAALALTEAQWCLVLDADEWIVRGGEAIAALRTRAPAAIGQISVASAFDAGQGALGEAPSWLPRVLPRGVRFEGRVHEQPCSALPRLRLPVLVGHDGYLAAQMAHKQGRNAKLLQLALAAQPDDAYLRYQLGKDFEVRAEFGAAAPHYLQALAHVDARAAWRHDLVLRTLFTLKKLGRFEAAFALAQGETPRWSQSPDFYFTLGDLLLDWATSAPARAGELLPMIESSWLRAIEIGEQPELHDTVRGRGSFLAAHNLAVLYAGLGNAAQAQHWRAREAAFRGNTVQCSLHTQGNSATRSSP
jgi:glycosyltransferase involved in cell wall biosynthesis